MTDLPTESIDEPDGERPRSRTATALALLTRCIAALALVALLVGYTCFLQVPTGSAAIVTRFGRPVREITEAGPYFKLPWPLEDARLIDTRSQIFNTPYTATLTRDRRNVVLLTYVVWRVEEPLQFLRSVGDTASAVAKLDGMVTAAKNTLMGNYDLSALVSTDPQSIKTPEIETAIEDDVRQAARDRFGIAVDQVGIKRIAYESVNVEAVLSQMRAERQSEANELRAIGERDAQRIRDDANVRSEQILSDGRLESGRIRGNAEREAAEIYAQAHRSDPEFYRYWRSLQALQQTIGERTTVILRTDQGFFGLLTEPPPVGAPSAPSTPVTDDPNSTSLDGDSSSRAGSGL